MIVFKKADDIQSFLSKQRQQQRKIGFVPTMGALHAGHISLVTAALDSTDWVVASIFVNPTQFNDPADFSHYPKTIEADVLALEKAGCHALFLPDVAEIYPNGTQPTRQYDLGYIETVLDGAYRPGHFQGVCQVVDRLLQIVGPDSMFLGQKDFQQCMVLKRMAAAQYPHITIQICATLRESTGLAMSSRNLRLTTQQRTHAALIYETLLFIKQSLRPGDVEQLTERALQYLTQEGFRPDYVTIAQANTLEPVASWDGTQPLVVLAAAFLGEVRLIDNMLLHPEALNVIN